MPADATAVTVTAEGGVVEIPFRLVNNHLILPVRVNGSEELSVVLDTGMPATGLALHTTERTKGVELDVDPSFAAQVGGAGGSGKRLSAQIAMSELVELPGLELEGTRVILMPEMDGFARYHDGIIGYSLLRDFVVEIDYEANLLRLHEPGSYEAPETAVALPITLRGNIPYTRLGLRLQGGEKIEAQVVVDLGASHAISLNTDAAEQIFLPDNRVETAVGRGLSGVLLGHFGRVAELNLGGAVLRDVVASFPGSEHQNPRGIDSLHGNLGSDVLKRFRVVFDYPGGRMLLTPNSTFGEPFRFDRSGLGLSLMGELRVEQVYANSPAAVAGVQVDDLLTHIDGSPVEARELHKIRERLRGDGEVRLSFLRDGETFERTLTLRPIL